MIHRIALTNWEMMVARACLLYTSEGSMYGYGLEEILSVVIYLTNKYTSGESSSVPYEKEIGRAHV